MTKHRFFSFLICILFAGSGFTQQHPNDITGIWKVVSVQTIQANGSVTTTIPAESQVIFTKNHYSLCWTSHHTRLENWSMPDSIKLARMNQSIINAGTYEIRDSLLTTYASFAMNPKFVNGKATFTCKLINDKLILTGINVLSPENISNPLYANGAHIVNTLIKISDIQ